MAESYEILVRPYVNPNIRPGETGRKSPLDDPEFNKAVLGGSGGQVVKLTFSEASSWSKSRAAEVERTVTRQRVYQEEKDDKGKKTVNPENYVDVEHVTKMKMQEGDGTLRYDYYAEPPEAPNIETLEVNVTIPNPNVPPAEPTSGGAAP